MRSGIRRMIDEENQNSLVQILPYIRCTGCPRPTSLYHGHFVHLLKQGWSEEEALDKLGIRSTCCRATLINPQVISNASSYGADVDIFEGVKALNISDKKPPRSASGYRGMRSVKAPPPPVAPFSVQTTVKRPILVALDESSPFAESAAASSGSSVAAQTSEPDDLIEEPSSGLRLYGREVSGWVDVGEGYLVPVLINVLYGSKQSKYKDKLHGRHL